ncbi:MAG: hypothetical protein ACREUG_16450 [Steroidobacteraceae bacterium]
MSSPDVNSLRRRIVKAPAPTSPRLPAPIVDVECADDEDVVWRWTVTVEGRFVSGYRIVPKHRPHDS